MTSLEDVDYNPIDHLNALFGHPSTLSAASAVGQSVSRYQHDLDYEIDELVTQQAASDADSVQRIQAAKSDLDELFRRIEDVQARAAETERTIAEMTADIKRLDNTKRNLTLSMTALKRLQMLTTAYEQLQGLSSTRQYRECAQLLQAVIQLMAHFRTYRSVDQIAALSRNVSDIQRELLEQVCEDFEIAFAKGEIERKRGMLAEGCLVMDALGDNARSRLITWYCNTQLREYRQLFRSSEEAGSLDNISRRYSWFRRLLKTYGDHHAVLFPNHWHMDEVLANAFCEGTAEDLKGVLAKSVRRHDGQTLDPNLLLLCLQETLEFEHSLERKLGETSRPSIDTLSSVEEQRQPFAHTISGAFEPYLSVWVEAQDKTLGSMINKYRSQPALGPEEQFSPQMVITTSTELFSIYRSLLAQCMKLSTGQQLLELSKVFGKYLERYAQQVLLHYISERPGGQTPSKVPTLEDLVLVLNTADYCYNTSGQLEERIKSRIDEKSKDQVDLETQADEFMGIANAAIRGLVRKVEIDLEPGWRAMRNVGWGRIEVVGDTSSYVADICSRLRERVKEIMNMVHKQQYVRAFCGNVVELLAAAFTANIMQCKPISEVGAEQLLLDLYALSRQAEELITVNAPAGTTAPAGFIKRANQTMSRVTPLLKTLQVRPSPPESLVEAYLVHVADKSDSNFRKVLELKGVRKQDLGHLMELFVAHKSGPRHDSLPAQSAFLTPLVVMSSVPGGSIASLSNLPSLNNAHRPSLPNLFEGGSLGNAFLNAAKDSVDKLGTPSLSAVPSRNISPQPFGAAGQGVDQGVNQNLKSIGKFFKRDLSGFGARFGAGKAGEDSGN